jgi:signal transduction histidine kinase
VTGEAAELEAQHERVRLLYRVSKVIRSTLEPEHALRLILREAVRLMRAGSGSVVLINPVTGFLEIQAAHGLPTGAANLKLRVGEGITGWVARTGKPARVGQVALDPRYVMVRPHVQSELAVPLKVNGRVRGVLNVDSDQADAFSEADQELLEELAVHAAEAIHHTWLYEQVRLKARLFEALVNVGQAINSTLNLDEALQAITREACGLMNGKTCSLLLRDASGEWLDLKASFGAGPAYLHKPRLSAADSLVGVVARRKKPLQVDDVQVSSRYQSRETARQEGLVSLLSVPLVYRGEAIGALNVYTGARHSFSNEEIGILCAMAELSALAIEKARLYERVVDVEEQLRQSERLSAIGLVAAEVAHEIRNPLTVLKLLFHSLDLKFAPGDPRSRDVEIVAEKLDHLNRTVERILDFTRSPEPAFARVELDRLLDDLTLLTRHKLSQQNIRLARRQRPDVPAVRGDAVQLSQAFLNLILNAVEAMPNGGQLVISTRRVRRARRSVAPAQVAVVFRDTGVGMSSAQRRHAFTSILHTTKARGVGLGLAIVGRVVEAHQGKVRVVSRPGRGTAITILLPVAGAAAPACGGPPEGNCRA